MVALARRFGLPIHAIGVGETIDDLRPFEATSFARALLGLELGQERLSSAKLRKGYGRCPGTLSRRYLARPCWRWRWASWPGPMGAATPATPAATRCGPSSTASTAWRSGGDVRLSGIKVGKVLSQELDPQTYRAQVTFSVRNGIELPSDSSAAIVSSGLLGGKYLSLVPGGDDRVLTDGGEITLTQSSVNLEDLIGRYIFSGQSGQGSGPQDRNEPPIAHRCRIRASVRRRSAPARTGRCCRIWWRSCGVWTRSRRGPPPSVRPSARRWHSGRCASPPRACLETPPTEPPESAAFLEIKVAEPGSERRGPPSVAGCSPRARRLSALEHPVYDVWVIGCAEPMEPEPEPPAPAPTPAVPGPAPADG